MRHTVLAALVERDSRLTLTLGFDEASDLVPAPGREVDDALLEGHNDGLTIGDRSEGNGSVCWWSQLRLTVQGLQALGEWPPTGPRMAEAVEATAHRVSAPPRLGLTAWTASTLRAWP
jgi:hypothetical protein